MAFKMTDDIYHEAEEQYYHYINNLNADNPSYSKMTLSNFRESISLKRPESLMHFHKWLSPGKAKEIKEGLGITW